MIKLKQNFNFFLGMTGGFVSPVTSTGIKIDNGATLTIGTPYIISTLGNGSTTLWQTVGVPKGVTPAAGLSFIAIATGGGSGNSKSSRVHAVGTSAIFAIEVVGNTGLSVNSDVRQYAGEYIIFQALNASSAPTAATAGSVFGGQLRFDDSSVTIDGI